MAVVMAEQDVFDLVTDSIIFYGIMIEVREEGLDGTEKIYKKHKKPIPGSMLFEEHRVKMIETIHNMETLKEQIDYIRKNEFLQFPVWMNERKKRYYDLVDQDIATRR